MTDLPYSKKMMELAEKWLAGSITEEEKKEFTDWYNSFNDAGLSLMPEYAPVIKALKEEMLGNIRQRIKNDENKRGLVFQMKRLRFAGAALLLLVASGALVVLLGRNTITGIALQKQTPQSNKDPLPGSNKAVLTLDDGSTIVLDGARTGSLTLQGNTRVVKSRDGQLQYQSVAGDNPDKISYNTLATPKGGQYKLVLPDGSQVWLNAASSIRYPAVFTGTERKVEVAGEAYFEIVKNASMPFRVLADHRLKAAHPMEIQVLGTQFNVNAYADEETIRTTLLEGSVKVAKGGASGILKPGQQSRLQENGEMVWIPNADVEKAMAWKNGVFEFGDENLQTILRQIARWYDVEVVYEGSVPTERFTGRVSRNTSLSGVLKILKLSDIRLTVENNKIIVRL
ncbi:FecR family protein [Flavitalea flava]